MDILNEFGIKPILLAAQIANFLILLYILKRFLYKPILKVLEDRKTKIAESLKNADEIGKKLLQTEEERNKKLGVAAKEAQEIIKEATVSANQIIQEAHKKAEEDIKKISEKAADQIKLDREKMGAEMRSELINLVVVGLETVTGKVLDQKDQKNLLDKSLKGLS